MVVHDLNVDRIFAVPHKAHAVSVIDANAVLTFSISFQRLQMVPPWNRQIVKARGPMKDGELLRR